MGLVTDRRRRRRPMPPRRRRITVPLRATTANMGRRHRTKTQARRRNRAARQPVLRRRPAPPCAPMGRAGASAILTNASACSASRWKGATIGRAVLGRTTGGRRPAIKGRATNRRLPRRDNKFAEEPIASAPEKFGALVFGLRLSEVRGERVSHAAAPQADLVPTAFNFAGDKHAPAGADRLDLYRHRIRRRANIRQRICCPIRVEGA